MQYILKSINKTIRNRICEDNLKLNKRQSDFDTNFVYLQFLNSIFFLLKAKANDFLNHSFSLQNI